MGEAITTKKDNMADVVSWLVALYPLGAYYGVGSFSISIIAFLFVLIYFCCKRRCVKFIYPLTSLYYISYFFITKFFFNFPTAGIIAYGSTLIFILWGFINNELQFEKFLRVYRIVVFINIVFLAIQEILYYTIGHRIIGIMTFLPLTLGDEFFDPEEYKNVASLASRSAALFSEPAHFAQYLLPLFTIELLYVRTRKAYLRCVIYLITLMLLASGNALIGLLVIACFFLVQIMEKMNPIISSFIVMLFLIISIVFCNYMKQTEYGEKIFNRFDELEYDQTRASSGFIRIFRGFYILKEMDGVERLLGLNSVERVKQKINQCDVATTFGDNDTYMSGWQGVIIYTGYIGLFLFCGILIWLWYGNNIAGRCCIILISVLFCFAALYLSYTSILYFTLAFLLKKKQNQYRVKCFVLGKNICNL